MNERVKLFPMIDVLREKKLFSCNIWKENQIWNNKLYLEFFKNIFDSITVYVCMKYYENNLLI